MRHLVEGFLGLLAPPRCVGCEEPDRSVFCDTCESLLERAAASSAVLHYGGPIADAIHRFKYQDRSDLADALGSLMAEAAGRWSGRVDGVVPVPLHWRRRRSRGYDQAALLAKPIAKSLVVPALLRGLRRVRHTPSQVDLPYHARQRNVAGAFAPARLGRARRVLLVDDVRTTGATLNAASRALFMGGVDEVHTLVLATRVLTEGT
jgi:ComF family protein